MGKKFKFSCNSQFHKRNLLLHSCHKSPGAYSESRKNQEVCTILKNDYNCVWEIEHVDPAIRFEMYAEKVPANEPILIKHSNTGHFLASDTVKYKNQYADEYDVSVFSYAQLK